MVTIAIVAAAAVLVVDSRLSSSVAAYVAFTIATLCLGYDPHAGIAHLALFALLAAIKILAGPAAVLLLARRYHLPGGLRASVNSAWRFAIVALLGAAAYAIAQMPALAAVPQAGVVLFAVFASIATVVLHRNLMAHVVGLLAFGNAIALAGAIIAPGLPGSIELADTFDAVIATLVGVLIARALVAYDPHLDVRSLRELRG